MALVHSSVIVTGAAVDTRTRDQLSFPFSARPQAMTIYVRFVEMGTVVSSGIGTLRILQIGALDGSAPLLGIEASPSVYRIRYNNGITAAVTSAVGVVPSVGNRIELRGVFQANGSIFLGQSLNEGSEVTSTPTAALAIAPAWSGAFLMVNSVGAVATTTGINAFRNICIVAGVKTLQEMRAWAGTD